MTNIRLMLPESARTALTELAIRERRDVRGQAEILILAALERRGLLARRVRDVHVGRATIAAASRETR